jgi:asparagine synthase (glutamine-hydrolysing)
MFAFAIWDGPRNRLWVGRDRVGIKPLVYYWDGKRFVFASEIKALITDSSIPKEINYEALMLYMSFNYIPAPHTIFKGIQKLEPGHFIVVENNGIKIEKYWDVTSVPSVESKSLSLKDQETNFKIELREILDHSVHSRMIADVPLGAFLSGGIDSSIIVAIMSKYSDKPIKTFSIGYTGDRLYDETAYAREVSKRYRTEHHEFKLSYQDVLKALPDVISSFDEPFANSSAIPTYIVSRETRKHVTVALSGDGGDELFAGYRYYLAEYWFTSYMMIPGLIRKGILENLIKRLPDSRDSSGLEYIRRIKKFIRGTKGPFDERILALKEVFPGNIRQNILVGGLPLKLAGDPALKTIERLLNGQKLDRINRILYSDLKDSLPNDMLTRVDWMSMKNSLEVRVPFLDHRLVEFAFQMPGSLKLKYGKTKYILKEAFRDLLPASILRRSKSGFEMPISRWLKTDLRFLLDRYLEPDRIKAQGIFDSNIVQQLVGLHLKGETDTSWMLWNLIVFQSWYEKYYL